MSRPQSIGLDYFPLHSSLFDHNKLNLAEEMIDPSGENSHLRLLVDKMIVRFYSYIFKSGYSLIWNEDAAKGLSAYIGNGMNPTWLKKFLHVFLKCGFLHEEMYDKHGILTSKGIQEQWYVASRLARRTCVNPGELTKTLPAKYKLFDEHNISSRRNKKKPAKGAAKKKKNKRVNKKLVPEEKVVSSRRNHINVMVSSARMALYPHSKTENWLQNGKNGSKSEFLPEETPQKGPLNYKNRGFSFLLLLYNNKSIVNTISNNTNYSSRNDKIPEETSIPSGINEDKGGFIREETAGQQQFNTEETANNSTTPVFVPIKIDPNGMQVYSIDHCAWNYLNNPDFSMTREQHVANLGVMSWGPERFKKWVEAFNRQLVNDGRSMMPMNGNGWCRYFKQWVPKIKNYMELDPDTLFTHEEIKDNGNQQQRSQSKPIPAKATEGRVGGIPKDKVAEFLSRKTRTGDTEPTP